jgi:hypothetical protein
MGGAAVGLYGCCVSRNSSQKSRFSTLEGIYHYFVYIANTDVDQQRGFAIPAQSRISPGCLNAVGQGSLSCGAGRRIVASTAGVAGSRVGSRLRGPVLEFSWYIRDLRRFKVALSWLNRSWRALFCIPVNHYEFWMLFGKCILNTAMYRKYIFCRQLRLALLAFLSITESRSKKAENLRRKEAP